ncbi:MAG: hypothetical protein ABII82_00965, partial [Verrucomicrobiota bacterium]
MRRRLLSLCLVLLILPLLAAITSPWWLGAALGRIGPRWLGVEFSRYERLAGARVAIDDLVVRREGVTVRAERIETDSPWRWLRAWLTGGRAGVIELGDWTVDIIPAAGDGPDEGDSVSGWTETLQRVGQRVDETTAWLPPVQTRPGAVRWPDGEVRVGSATLRDGRLEVAYIESGDRRAEDLVLARDGAEWRLSARGPDDLWTARARIAGQALDADGQWSGQPWTLRAAFGPEGWRPLTAEAVATGWVLPGARFGWEQAYREITGDARVQWRDGRFDFTAEAKGAPVGQAPALEISLGGSGDENELALARAVVRAPGLTATLDEPVRLTTGGRLLSGESRFSLRADLADWPALAARGRVDGRVTVRPGDDGRPEVDAELAASGLEARGWRIEKVDADAGLRWPELVVRRIRVTLPGDESLSASGRYNLDTRALADGEVSGRLTAATYGPWLPGDVGLGEIGLKATARGVWPELEHGGELSLRALRTGWLKPVDGGVTWQGRGESAREFRLELRGDGVGLTAAGAADREAADLAEFDLSEGGVSQWRLVEPARVRWSPAPRIANLALAGPAGGLRVSGDATGFELQAESLDAGWLRPWLTADVP